MNNIIEYQKRTDERNGTETVTDAEEAWTQIKQNLTEATDNILWKRKIMARKEWITKEIIDMM